jgi:hypothetical protein
MEPIKYRTEPTTEVALAKNLNLRNGWATNI